MAGYIQDDWKPNAPAHAEPGPALRDPVGPLQQRLRHAWPGASWRAWASAPSARPTRTTSAPRVGFAYDVSGDAKRVARGGYGRYYDEIFQNITLYEYWSQVTQPDVLRLGLPAGLHAQRVHRQPRRHPQQLHRPQLRRAAPAPDLARPGAALVRPVQRRLLVAGGPRAGLRRRLRARQGQRRHPPLADQHGPEPEHAHSRRPGGSTRSTRPTSWKATAATRQYDAVYVTGKYRHVQGVADLDLHLERGQEHRERLQLPAGRHHATPNWEMRLRVRAQRHRAPLHHRARCSSCPADFQFSTSLQGNTGKPFNAAARPGRHRNAVRAINPATGRCSSATRSASARRGDRTGRHRRPGALLGRPAAVVDLQVRRRQVAGDPGRSLQPDQPRQLRRRLLPELSPTRPSARRRRSSATATARPSWASASGSSDQPFRNSRAPPRGRPFLCAQQAHPDFRRPLPARRWGCVRSAVEVPSDTSEIPIPGGGMTRTSRVLVRMAGALTASVLVVPAAPSWAAVPKDRASPLGPEGVLPAGAVHQQLQPGRCRTSCRSCPTARPGSRSWRSSARAPASRSSSTRARARPPT